MSRPYVSEFWRSFHGLHKPVEMPPAADTLRELDAAFWDAVEEELRVLSLASSTAPRCAIARARLDKLGVRHGC